MTAQTKQRATAAPPESQPDTVLADLAGMDDARQWGERLANDMALYRAGRIRWRDVDPGCVLHGPPGTGKTTFAKALAASCGLPLVATSFAEWQAADTGHLGSLLATMEGSFTRAREAAPCILFIDELDSIPKRGGSSKETTYWNQVTNGLLKAIDGLADGVVIVGACNHPDLLDEALVRSGRMDRKIAIPLPDAKAIETILAFHLDRAERDAMVRHEFGESPLKVIARLCVGMAGADLAKLVRETRSRARVARRVMAVEDFVAVLDPPETRKSLDYRRRIAVHEAGHAVAAYRLEIAFEINLSLVARRTSGGHASITLMDDAVTRDVVDRQLIMLMAGRAAEHVFFRNVSSGAGGGETSDLAVATKLAIDAVARFGLSKRAPLVWLQNRGTDKSAYPPVVQAEVDEMLDNAYDAAIQLIQQDWDFVNETANALLRSRALAHREFVRLDRRPRD